MSNLNLQKVRISGKSMHPFLKTGSILSFTMDTPVQLGDICLIRDSLSHELIVHRLVSVSPLIFKGDNTLNIERGKEFTLLGVALDKRRSMNKLIALFSLSYKFETFRLKRIISKIFIRVLSV